MRKWIVAFLLALALVLPVFAADNVLDNAGVVQMVHLGLSKNVITAKIHASQTHFDTSPNALAKLKRDGVPSDIVAAMIEGGGSGNGQVVVNSTGVHVNNQNNGVFEFEGSNGPQPMDAVRVTAEISTRKAWIPFYHGGPETFMFIDGRHATLKTSVLPTFLTTMDPINIRLVHMGEKKGRESRYVVFSGSSTDREVQVKTERTSNGDYHIQPTQPLKIGDEYAFLVQNSLPAGCAFWACFAQYASASKAFDFGVE